MTIKCPLQAMMGTLRSTIQMKKGNTLPRVAHKSIKNMPLTTLCWLILEKHLKETGWSRELRAKFLSQRQRFNPTLANPQKMTPKCALQSRD